MCRVVGVKDLNQVKVPDHGRPERLDQVVLLVKVPAIEMSTATALAWAAHSAKAEAAKIVLIFFIFVSSRFLEKGNLAFLSANSFKHLP